MKIDLLTRSEVQEAGVDAVCVDDLVDALIRLQVTCKTVQRLSDRKKLTRTAYYALVGDSKSMTDAARRLEVKVRAIYDKWLPSGGV